MILIWSSDLNRTEYGTEWRGMNLELTLIIPPIICLINCLIKLHLIADKLKDRAKIDFHVYAPHLSYLPFQLQIRTSTIIFDDLCSHRWCQIQSGRSFGIKINCPQAEHHVLLMLSANWRSFRSDYGSIWMIKKYQLV